MTGTVAAILMWAILGLFRIVVPPGTAIPIYLDQTLDAKQVKVGQPISGTITQDVPLGDRGRILEGSHVTGRVVAAGRHSDGSSYIRIRFDQLKARKWGEMPIVTSLRAMASPWDVQDAQLPKVGPMIASNPAAWTTYQIGGDAVLRGGGPVLKNRMKVGVPVEGVTDGVLERLVSLPEPGCRAANDGRLQAVWVFGTAACGAYGFGGNLEVVHAGDVEPFGDIELRADKNVHVPTGSGLLLMAIKPRAETVLVASN